MPGPNSPHNFWSESCPSTAISFITTLWSCPFLVHNVSSPLFSATDACERSAFWQTLDATLVQKRVLKSVMWPVCFRRKLIHLWKTNNFSEIWHIYHLSTGYELCCLLNSKKPWMAKEGVLKEVGSVQLTIWQASPGPARSQPGRNLHRANHCIRQRG